MALTGTKIRAIKATRERREHPDRGGLVLRVSGRGATTWTMSYRVRGRGSVRHRRPDDAPIRARPREVAAERRRFGRRRRPGILPEREGIGPDHKGPRWPYAEERPQVRRRGGRKPVLGTRAPTVLPRAPNRRWSLDFASGALTGGRRFRVLAVVDGFSRGRLCPVADTPPPGARVARQLDAAVAVRGWTPIDLRERQRRRTGGRVPSRGVGAMFPGGPGRRVRLARRTG